MADFLTNMFSSPKPTLSSGGNLITIQKKENSDIPATTESIEKKEEIKEDEIIIVYCVHKYKYKWSQLKKYPQFWVTKRILENGISRAGYACYSCHHDLYSIIHLYILTGEPIFMHFMRKKVGCSEEAIRTMLKCMGFGDEMICK